MHSDKREKLNDIHEYMVTVANGEVIATIFPATPGTDGIDVHGQRVNSMNGKNYTSLQGKM